MKRKEKKKGMVRQAGDKRSGDKENKDESKTSKRNEEQKEEQAAIQNGTDISK